MILLISNTLQQSPSLKANSRSFASEEILHIYLVPAVPVYTPPCNFNVSFNIIFLIISTL
jgi:hypothetical protein